MENVDKNIVDDALGLCGAALRTKEVGSERLIAMEELFYLSYPPSEVKYAYKFLETPFLLEKLDILRVITDTPKKGKFLCYIPPRGFYIVE